MIRGVMKMRSSRLSSVTSSRLNSKPRSGTRLSPGVRDCVVCSVLRKMPPMTVVSPLATRTEVFARCVLIGGLPSIAREKSGEPFSTTMRMITVLADVIWQHPEDQRRVLPRHGHGVVRNRLDRDLNALHDLGFDVALRGDPGCREN